MQLLVGGSYEGNMKVRHVIDDGNECMLSSLSRCALCCRGCGVLAGKP